MALTDVAFERSSGNADEAPSRIALDELTLRAAPLSLLLGGLEVDFGAEIGDGEIDGSYEAENGVMSHIDAELDAVDLGRARRRQLPRRPDSRARPPARSTWRSASRPQAPRATS